MIRQLDCKLQRDIDYEYGHRVPQGPFAPETMLHISSDNLITTWLKVFAHAGQGWAERIMTRGGGIGERCARSECKQNLGFCLPCLPSIAGRGRKARAAIRYNAGSTIYSVEMSPSHGMGAAAARWLRGATDPSHSLVGD